MIRALCFFIVGLLLYACSGWNSELDTQYIPDTKFNAELNKPVCEFKPQDNCFSRSINLLMACVQDSNGGEEVLTEDLRLCTNETGKRIIFDTPLDLVANFSEDELSFTIYSNQNKCFRFTGTRENFRVDQNAFGTLEAQVLANGDVQVSCFFNETLVIPKEAQEKGCRGSKVKTGEFIPAAHLQKKAAAQFLEPSDINSFRFNFRGTDFPTQVFDCSL